MAEERGQRRLAPILVADVVGYSRLMEADETGFVKDGREGELPRTGNRNGRGIPAPAVNGCLKLYL
jgi:class 3 adenylate cyclase